MPLGVVAASLIAAYLVSSGGLRCDHSPSLHSGRGCRRLFDMVTWRPGTDLAVTNSGSAPAWCGRDRVFCRVPLMGIGGGGLNNTFIDGVLATRAPGGGDPGPESVWLISVSRNWFGYL